jgi:hypothetical protein
MGALLLWLLCSCPDGTTCDPARAASLFARLHRAPPPGVHLCFDDAHEPSVTRAGTVLLPAHGQDAGAAARLAHLLLHLSQDPHAACDEREREAVAVERALLTAWRAPALPSRDPCAEERSP